MIDTSPFKFLDAYQKEDHDIFFGREVEVETLYKMTFQTNLILVYGMSGTGKTSIIQCGLANRFDDSDWFEVFVRRQENINSALVREMIHMDQEHSFQKDFSLVEMVRSLYLDHLRPIYLIFDQFEELFILGSKEEQETFIKSIKPLIEKNNLPCKIIIVIREEYLAQLTDFEKEVPQLFEKRLRIEPMNRANARQVILQTAKNQKFNIKLQPPTTVPDLIIDSVTEGKGRVQLTYLQVLLDKLYRSAARDEEGAIIFDETLVRKAGQIDDILGGFLDEQLLVFEREVDNKDLALRFLKVFVSEKGTKIPVARAKLEDRLSEMTLAKITIYLAFFTDRRILRPLDNDQFELSHDSLANRVFEAKTKAVTMPKLKQPEQELLPFVGFEPYGTKMGVFFHGRGIETRELFDKIVNEIDIRTTLVFGPLGVGKTSLILAGLLPRIQDMFVYQYLRCSRTFIESAKMQYMLNNEPVKGEEPRLLDLAFQWEKDQPTEQERKVIILDQFEEFYIWIQETEKLYNFYKHVDFLLKARQNCDLIFVVRDEFFSMLQDFETEVPGILNEQVRVKHVDQDAAMRIVEKLAIQADIEIEDEEIVAKIVENVLDDDGKVNLSYLQVYLKNLYQQIK